MTNSYDTQTASNLDRLQPPMQGNADNDRLACIESLRHSIAAAEQNIAYWNSVTNTLRLLTEQMERQK